MAETLNERLSYLEFEWAMELGYRSLIVDCTPKWLFTNGKIESYFNYSEY